MRHFKQLTLSTLFALSAVLLLAGCGELNKKSAPGDGAPDCATQDQCKDPNQKCLSFNTKTEKGYCQATCTDTSANSTECGDGYKCALIAGSNDKACFKKCTNDKECGSGSICDTAGKVCVVQECTGTSDTSCGNGRECNDSTKACQGKAAPATQGPNPAKECQKDSDCGPIFGHCDTTTGMCNNFKLKGVVIKDLKGECASGADTDKGSDILGVELVNSDGTSITWGRNAKQLFPAEADKAGPSYNHPGSPDGEPPNYANGLNFCPTEKIGGNPEFSSTGCGGLMGIVFDDGKTIEGRGAIRVYEYNQDSCSSTISGGDRYEVYGCKAADFQASTTYANMKTYMAGNCLLLNTNLTGNTSTPFPKKP